MLYMAKKAFHNRILHNKSINLKCLEDIAGFKVTDTEKLHKVKHWDPPTVGWFQ